MFQNNNFIWQTSQSTKTGCGKIRFWDLELYCTSGNKCCDSPNTKNYWRPTFYWKSDLVETTVQLCIVRWVPQRLLDYFIDLVPLCREPSWSSSSSSLWPSWLSSSCPSPLRPRWPSLRPAPSPSPPSSSASSSEPPSPTTPTADETAAGVAATTTVDLSTNLPLSPTRLSWNIFGQWTGVQIKNYHLYFLHFISWGFGFQDWMNGHYFIIWVTFLDAPIARPRCLDRFLRTEPCPDVWTRIEFQFQHFWKLLLDLLILRSKSNFDLNSEYDLTIV